MTLFNDNSTYRARVMALLSTENTYSLARRVFVRSLAAHPDVRGYFALDSADETGREQLKVVVGTVRSPRQASLALCELVVP